MAYEVLGVDAIQWVLLILAIAATISLGYIMSRVVTHVLKVARTPIEVAKRSGKISSYAVYIAGSVVIIFYFAFDALGALVGLGVFGVAVGIGLGTVLSNIFSGIFVVASRTFKVGDHIKVAHFEGKVVKISIQKVTVETEEGETLFIPTGFFLSNPVARKCADKRPTECQT